MAETVEFKFHGRDEVMEIINTGGNLVEYLGTQTADCPLIGSEIQLYKELGKGQYGTVYLLKIEGMGSKEYVAKRTDYKLVYASAKLFFDMKEDKTLQQLAEIFERDSGVPAAIFISINGKDPNIIIQSDTKLYRPFKNEYDCAVTKSRHTYKRFEIPGFTVIPAGSYLCRSKQYSEYVIGLLCGNLYRKGISINFLDLFGFASCFEIPENKQISQYIFMEKIDKTARSIDSCIFKKSPLGKISEDVAIVALVQILHAIATYQDVYQLQHNDLHDDNIFIEFIRPDTMFNGEKLYDADWFHYRIKGVDLYLPYIPLIVKIGDFGLSVKYSSPMVGDEDVFSSGYDQHDKDGPWIPNWYSACYDMLFITRIFFVNDPNNIFIRRLFGKMLRIQTDIPTIENLYSAIDTKFKANHHERPAMDTIATLDLETSPLKILTDESLFGKRMQRPAEGKIVTLGEI